MSAAIRASRSLFRLRKWLCFEICSVHSIGYNFHSNFLLAISFRNQEFLFIFILSVGSKQRATTMLDFEHITHYSYFGFHCFLAQFQPCLLLHLCVCVCHIQAYNWFLFSSKLATPSSIRPFFCPTVASNSFSSWDKCPSNLWTLPTFSELANMSRDDLTSPVAAAATSS